MRKRFEVPVERLESGVLVLKRNHDDSEMFDPWATRRFENRVMWQLTVTLVLMFAVPVLGILILVWLLH